MNGSPDRLLNIANGMDPSLVNNTFKKRLFQPLSKKFFLNKNKKGQQTASESERVTCPAVWRKLVTSLSDCWKKGAQY